MQCPNCQHENEGGKFCVKCGTPLQQAADQANPTTSQEVETPNVPPTTPSPESVRVQSQSSENANQYIEGAKKISKSYFNHFLDVMKKPHAVSTQVGADQFINGIITIVLYSLIIPFIIYFALKGVIADLNNFGAGLFGQSMGMEIPFGDTVVKPFFAYLVFTLLVAVFTFVALKLAKIEADIKEVIARFASFLIPFVGILAVALILSLIKVELFLVVLLLGFVGAIFLVPALVVTSYKKQNSQGLDITWGIIAAYVLTFIAIRIMGEMLFDSLVSAFTSMFGGLL
ncbi:hypothetical protein GCM10008967_03970 [Bacillus carboniphilus]|uniref:Zinc ribbon domain-containing protein n=1 Tax=Bacillus carboniphilus TaxID=86663 RepID=A0ABP3FF94_9BACI